MKKAICIGGYLLLVISCCLLFTRYIFLYNIGNSHYRKANYEKAATAYEKALKANPPFEKECSIRTNLALSMVYGLGDDYAAPDNVDDSIETLKDARAVLIEEDCATATGDGHSEIAEQLKEEIEKLIEQLEQQEQGSDDSEDESQDESESEAEAAREQSIKEQLQQIQENAYEERQEQMNLTEEFEIEFNFDMETPIW